MLVLQVGWALAACIYLASVNVLCTWRRIRLLQSYVFSMKRSQHNFQDDTVVYQIFGRLICMNEHRIALTFRTSTGTLVRWLGLATMSYDNI